MMLLKKSYAEQLLQLALALSLLRVNPDSYLGYGWHTQLTTDYGDGLQLELQTAPIYDYAYTNRKGIIPIIEDLVHFNRYRETSSHDIQTYLLNIQNEGSIQSSQSQRNDTGGTENSFQAELTTTVAANNNSELDIFLNGAHFTESASVIELNLADLRDYDDSSLTYSLPLKDDSYADYLVNTPEEAAGTSFTSDLGASVTTLSNGSSINSDYSRVIDWSEFYDIAPVSKGSVTDETSSDDGTKEMLKLEPDSHEQTSSTSGFNSTVELTVEESEIVEVLWKQDVDLGYSLAPLKISSDSTSNQQQTSKNTEDDNEKLKALQDLKNELKNDKIDDPKDILEDEWAGIQFTIDNETGEYIQLPLQLDEILQDVLQIACDLGSNDSEEGLLSEEATSITEDSSTETKAKSKESESSAVGSSLSDVEISSDLSHINLDDASDLDEIDMMIQSSGPFQHPRSTQSYGHGANTFRQSFHHQSRVPFSRTVSMDQRFQDIANFLNPIPAMGVGMGVGDMPSYSHYPSHYSYQTAGAIPQNGHFAHPHSAVLHNASLAELGAQQPHYGPNLGTAVSSSMHITNATHDSEAGATGYKMDHDNVMYYSNTSSELNHTQDGFINSFLNDEDLQLIDINGVSESFYTMRMLETNSTSNNSSVLGASSAGSHSNVLTSSMQTNNASLGAIGATGDRLESSSDSAVSSMGSERVPSLSDGEWGDAGSDSAQDFHQRNSSKYGGPYDYSYSSRIGDSSRHPVAQKKHHMFGKRYFQEQSNVPTLPQQAQQSDIPIKYEYEPYGMHTTIPHSLDGATGPVVSKHPSQISQPEMKYSCSLDFARQNRGIHDLVSHNHTYTLPQGTGASPRPQARDKKQRKIDEEHLSRDEKRARALNIPMPVHEIINLPMDEFNERLSKYDLSETQLSLIRDIRRRGKNKVAAQNCRKRKLDQIICLADEVKEVRKRKDRIYRDREMGIASNEHIKHKFSLLHKHIFQNLRDNEGNLYSPSEFSLQQSHDGSIHILRKDKDSRNNTSNQSHQQGPSSHHQQHHPHHQKD